MIKTVTIHSADYNNDNLLKLLPERVGMVLWGMHQHGVSVFLSAMAGMIVMVGVVGNSTPAHALLEVDITEGHTNPLTFSIPSFVVNNATNYGAEKRIGRDISRIISSDLAGTGLFRQVDPAAFIGNSPNINLRPSFPDWRVINVQALILGRVVSETASTMRVEIRLWDVFTGQELAGIQYQTEKDNWRRVAHLVADEIYQRITGEAGYFDTRIVYVAETGPKDDRIKILTVMDQDGFNPQPLTDGRLLVITPRFSPVDQELVYMAYGPNGPRVYLLDVATGHQEIVGDFPGMTFAPRFMPDGEHVVMSVEDDGSSDIYIMDLETRRANRLTAGRSINTAPSPSPDGKFIAFESDRGGGQQIYVMGVDGSNPRRISFGEGSYGTPVWSPRGDLIAFTKRSKGQFLVGVMEVDGTGERILAKGYHNEGPSWSPNGRVLIFFRETRGENGGPELWTVDVTGQNLRQLPAPTFASDPSWSPPAP
ncbi:MAG: Tol-Pal system beta propeller repeat protein TolB [Parvularculales bacterium]